MVFSFVQTQASAFFKDNVVRVLLSNRAATKPAASAPVRSRWPTPIRARRPPRFLQFGTAAGAAKSRDTAPAPPAPTASTTPAGCTIRGTSSYERTIGPAD